MTCTRSESLTVDEIIAATGHEGDNILDERLDESLSLDLDFEEYDREIPVLPRGHAAPTTTLVDLDSHPVFSTRPGLPPFRSSFEAPYDYTACGPVLASSLGPRRLLPTPVVRSQALSQKGIVVSPMSCHCVDLHRTQRSCWALLLFVTLRVKRRVS